MLLFQFFTGMWDKKCIDFEFCLWIEVQFWQPPEVILIAEDITQFRYI